MPSREISTKEISDRIRINDLLIRYTVAIDQKDWGLLDTCFTPDAHLDYTSAGGVKGSYPEVRQWLEKALAAFPMTVHLIGNSVVELSGDEATATTFVINPMGSAKPDGSLHIFTVGAHYHDKLVHTEDGWRIRERIEKTAYMDGSLPEGLQIPT